MRSNCGRFGDIKVEVPERRGEPSTDLLQLIIDRSTRPTGAGIAKKALVALKPLIEKRLKDEGIPLDLSSLGADSDLSARAILSLPAELPTRLGRPVIFYLDELQRLGNYTDGDRVARDLVDLYSGREGVTVLVDGSDDRALEMLERDVQLDKLCSVFVLGETIPDRIWRQALPERFRMAELDIDEEGLNALIAFGGGRPFPTMLAARQAALSAQKLGQGKSVGLFEATMGIDEARRQLGEADGD